MTVDEGHRRVYQVELNLYSSFVTNHIFEPSCNEVSLDVRDERTQPLRRKDN